MPITIQIHLLGDVGNGLRDISNAKSFTVPVNLILARCGLAVGEEQAMVTQNLGGYILLSSLSFRSSRVLSKKSISLNEI